MAYVPNIIGKDEKLIGIARLHWIYIVSGLTWFLGLTYVGTFIQGLVEQFAIYVSQTITSPSLMVMLMNIGDNALFVMMAIGGCILLFNVLKVISTEIGLSNRRVIMKSGIIFVKVKQIDIEEIRGESLDLGSFGRMLNYGALNLDCRFIGDVKLPFIARAETFLKALHAQRAKAQDVLSIAVGKSNPTGVEIVAQNPPQTPPPPSTPATPIAPPPEAPPQTPAVPEVPLPPATPPQTVPDPQPVPQQEPPMIPQTPTEVPSQPTIPQQVPSEPPPTQAHAHADVGNVGEITEATLNKLTPDLPPNGLPEPHMEIMADPPQQPPPPEVPAQPVIPPQVPSQPTAPQGHAAAAVNAASVAEVVREMMPAMAQQVVKELAEQGLINTANDRSPDEPDELAAAFDEAALQKKANDRGSVFKTSYAVN